MFLAYRFRLLPSKRQHRVLESILESQRQLYNAALQERIDCYIKTGKSISCRAQFRSLTTCRRELPEMAAIPVKLQRWTLAQLDGAFQGFFRRLKVRKEKAGYPRFRGIRGWNSFGFADCTGIQFDCKRLYFKGMSSGLKVHVHRKLPKNADVRSCVFRRDLDGWFISFQIAEETNKKDKISTAIGVDLGLNVFAYCSNGYEIPNPRIARKAEKEMRRRQRALARCKRGSKRRQKVCKKLSKLHQKIVNTRTTWLHQKSIELVNNVDLIAVEDLNVRGMLKHPKLARSIQDVSWSKFLSMLEYKAEKAGVRFIRVDPKHTSQKCSGCGKLVPKSLAVRIHSCPHCGLVINRDYNASRNILQAGLMRAGLSAEWLTWPSGASVHSETRTVSQCVNPLSYGVC
jgi:putative transposase